MCFFPPTSSSISDEVLFLLLPGRGVGLRDLIPVRVRGGLTSGTLSDPGLDGIGVLLLDRVRKAGPGDRWRRAGERREGVDAEASKSAGIIFSEEAVA